MATNRLEHKHTTPLFLIGQSGTSGQTLSPSRRTSPAIAMLRCASHDGLWIMGASSASLPNRGPASPFERGRRLARRHRRCRFRFAARPGVGVTAKASRGHVLRRSCAVAFACPKESAADRLGHRLQPAGKRRLQSLARSHSCSRRRGADERNGDVAQLRVQPTLAGDEQAPVRWRPRRASCIAE